MAFYHIGIDEALEEWSGPRFFKRAWRTSAFSGVMAARIAAEQQEQSENGAVSGSSGGHRYGSSENDLRAINLASKKPGEVAQLIDYSRAPEGG